MSLLREIVVGIVVALLAEEFIGWLDRCSWFLLRFSVTLRKKGSIVGRIVLVGSPESMQEFMRDHDIIGFGHAPVGKSMHHPEQSLL